MEIMGGRVYFDRYTLGNNGVFLPLNSTSRRWKIIIIFQRLIYIIALLPVVIPSDQQRVGTHHNICIPTLRDEAEIRLS